MRTLSFAAAFLLLCVTASPALSTTHYITDDGLGDYPTIQAAIDAASAGDTIMLAPGTFSGTGNWDLDFGGKNLVVRSELGRLGTIINCHGGSSGEHRAFHFHSGEDPSSKVYDIQIYDGYVEQTNGGGILIENGSNPTIEFCYITDCRSEGSTSPANDGVGGGIAVYNSAPHIIDNLIYSNHAEYYGGGLYMEYSPAIVMGNDIYGNAVTSGGGAFYAFECAATIINNWFDANSTNGAVIWNVSVSATFVTFHNNLITNNVATFAAGLYWEATTGVPFITSCTFLNNQDGGVYTTSSAGIKDCIFHLNGSTPIDAPGATVTYCWVEGGYTGTGNIVGTTIAWDFGVSAEPYLPEGNECLDAGSDLASNVCIETEAGYRCFNQMSALQSERPDTGVVDIGYHYLRQRKTLYVPGDTDKIQTAIECAVTGDRIEVEGDLMHFYDPIDFLGKAVHVIGVGTYPAIIHGGGSSTCVTFENGETAGSILEDIFLHGGSGLTGGGIYIDGASPVIRGCVISSCTSDNGAGMHCTGGSPYLENVSFTENTGLFGGGVLIDGGSPVFNGGYISENTALIGAGAYCYLGSPEFTGIGFFENIATGTTNGTLGAGIYSYHSDITLTRCSFSQNDAQANNGIGKGGGIYLDVDAETPVIDHCAFGGNTALSGAGIAVFGGPVDIYNTIVAFNRTGEGIYCDTGGEVNIECSDVYNNDGGDWVGCIAGMDSLDNNFRADPVFCDLLFNSLVVSSSSPCASANNPSCGWVGAYEHSCWTEVHTINAAGTGDFATIQEAIDNSEGGDTILLEDGTYTGPGNVDVSFGAKSVTVKSVSGNVNTCIIDCEATSTDTHRAFILNNREGHGARIEGLRIRNGWSASSGGGVVMHRAHATVKNCLFDSCRAFDGGGLSAYKSESLFDDLIFESCAADDAGGGIYLHTSNPILRDCFFEESWANWGGGGLYNHYSAPYMERCIFAGCTSDHWGGGLHNNHPTSTPVLQNCTFSRNAAPTGGGMFSRNNAAPVVYNTIIAFSEDGVAVHTQTGAVTTLYCCDVYGNIDGDYVGGILGQDGINGNFSADPLFCNDLIHYLRLTDSSPCTQANSSPECGLIGGVWENCHQSTDVEEPDATPTVTRLYSCYPNPFNPNTRIAFDLNAPGHVSLRVYDAAGRLIRTLVDETRRAGRFEEAWNGKDNRGIQVASGVYFYRLTAGDFVESRKMILLR